MAIINITPNFEESAQENVTLTHVSYTEQLDDLTYRIDLKNNKRDGLWYLDLYNLEGTPLLLGVGLATGIDLFYPYRYRKVPPGVLFVSPQNAGSYSDPGIDSFVEGTHTIYYVEAT